MKCLFFANLFQSLSSLRFADRVKGLKANAIAAGDPAAEQEFLEKLRIAEQIAADVRIAQGATDYKIQRPRSTRGVWFFHQGKLQNSFPQSRHHFHVLIAQRSIPIQVEATHFLVWVQPFAQGLLESGGYLSLSFTG